jgi:hypothetical protein
MVFPFYDDESEMKERRILNKLGDLLICCSYMSHRLIQFKSLSSEEENVMSQQSYVVVTK